MVAAGWLVFTLLFVIAISIWGAFRFGRACAARDLAQKGSRYSRRAREIDEIVAGLDDVDLDRRLLGDADSGVPVGGGDQGPSR
jgi:hypothetical protein